MSLTLSHRLETLLGHYAVGKADALADTGLVAIVQDYRRKTQAQMQSLDPAQLAQKLPAADWATYHVSLKIDGEFNLLVYQQGEAILVNASGTVRTGLPDLANAAWHLEAAGIRSAIIAGELWYERAGQRERVHDVSRVARNPASEEDLLNLRFTAFDLLDLDGK